VIEQPPLPPGRALAAVARCVGRSAVLLVRRRLHQPNVHVGEHLRFADGTSALVYRETVIDRSPPDAPVALVIGFRLRWVRGEWAHRVFRLESLLNTVLFAGFPGFVSKLWCRHDEHGLYRGVYEWDGASLAEDYVRALWWVLAVVSVRDSIHYTVRGARRDELLDDPHAADLGRDERGSWWRVVEATPHVA
jgi:hypothetical protein